MRIALVHNAVFPVSGYGGTERVVWWLAKALSQLGCSVTLFSKPQSRSEFAEVRLYTERPTSSFDIVHYFNTPTVTPEFPYIVTIGGNGKAGESFLPNTVFVSRDHARRHSSEIFVYNGVDPDEYCYETVKSRELLFLAKASWRVKNVRGAIRLAKRSQCPLRILGGYRPWPINHRHEIHWEGMKGGLEKAKIISQAKALLFPVLWDEPFGLAVVESLISGTPVIASPFGSLPELISRKVGFLCDSEDAFIAAIESVSLIQPKDCRDWAIEKFSHMKMADAYLKLYERVVRGELLNRLPPHSKGSARLYALASIQRRQRPE